MVRTRFAPSPTGYLHIGGARTALFCWLYARKTQGTFILRIEDTDLERSTPESVQAILEGMNWLQLNYDEGPYYQTKRFERYAAVIQQLLAENKAYKCYCSKERLEKLRETQMMNKEKPRYDGRCREIKEQKEVPFVVRFKNPLEGVVEFIDLVRGILKFANQELDDLIIARSDGTPTYNFTVVVDDWDMKITHILRGDDHINNTPRQINILEALGATIPRYGHVPMILGEDGKRLSKRHGAVSVMQYREEGILPHALLNYLARLGWSHGDQEIFTKQELINYFNIESINRSPAALNQEKLLWLNQYYMKNDDPAELGKELAWHFDKLGVNTAHGPDLIAVIKAQCERTKTLKEMAERSRYFYEEVPIPAELQSQFIPELLGPLKMVCERLNNLEVWSKEAIHEILASTAELFAIKMGKLAPLVRIAVTGGTISPSIDLTLLLVGKDKVVQRIANAVKDYI